jgi:CRISPR-associated endonuclease/helicase Cas3
VGEALSAVDPEDLLDVYPLKPHELLRDRTDRVRKHLGQIAERVPNTPAWLVSLDGSVWTAELKDLLEKDGDADRLSNRTVLLPPAAGGLDKGLLNGSAAFDPQHESDYDVSNEWFEDRERTRRWRRRTWDEEDNEVRGVRLIRTIVCPRKPGRTTPRSRRRRSGGWTVLVVACPSPKDTSPLAPTGQ